MNRALWYKAVSDSRLSWLCCAVLLFGFCWIRVWITSQVDMTQFEGILQNLPEAWQRLSPVPIRQLISYPTRIALTYEEPLVYLAIAVWTLARSSDCVSGEIGRGTMELLLAQPASRLEVLLAPTAVTLMGTALLVVIAWSGTWTGIAMFSVHVRASDAGWTIPMIGFKIPLIAPGAGARQVPMIQLVNPHLFWPAVINMFALGVFLTGVGTFLSSIDRYRWRTIGIVVAVYVVQMITEVVSLAVEEWRWLKWCTFFSAYEPVAIVSRSLTTPEYMWSWGVIDRQGQWIAPGPLAYDAILIGLGLLAFLAAIFAFLRRDLPAPL